MRTMKKMMLLAIMAVLGLQAKAQSSSTTGWSTVGVEYLPMTMDFGNLGSTSFSGFALNYTNAIGLTSDVPLFLEWGVGAQYTYKSKNDVTIQCASLKVPVNLLYNFQLPDTKVNLAPYVGLKFRGNVWGEASVEDESWNLFGDEMDCKRFQVGWNIGVKARFNDKMFIGVGYGSDFNEFADGTKISEVSLQLGIVL